MLVEDDGWDEKEVEPENEDDPISDLDNDHNKIRITQGLIKALECIPTICVLDLQLKFGIDFHVILVLCMLFHVGLNIDEILVSSYW